MVAQLLAKPKPRSSHTNQPRLRIVVQQLCHIQLQEIMSINIYFEKLNSFVQRIRNAFILEQDTQNTIAQRRQVTAWVLDEIARVKDKKEELSKASGLQGLLLMAGLNSSRLKELQASQAQLLSVKEQLKGQIVDLQEQQIEKVPGPQEIRKCLRGINKRRMPDHYGFAFSPLFKSCFVKSREGYEKCIKNTVVNNLRCTSLGQESLFIIKSQRYCLEQLFEHLFAQTCQLSTVIKIEVESKIFDKPIEIFCWIEDMQGRPKLYRPLSALKTDEASFNLYLEQAKQRLYVDEISMLHCFLTQLLIVPIQTVIPDYVLTQSGQEKSLSVRKLQGTNQEKDIFFYMKQHPSLRNPLAYFYSFIRYYQFDIKALVKVLEPELLTSRFYQILNILSRFMRNDFTLKHNQLRTYSLCLDDSVISTLWDTFQEIIVLAGWLQEVIAPVKQTVTVAEIKGKLYPIFNELAKAGDMSYEQYRTLMLNNAIEASLTINGSKINIEKYKDRYVSLNSIKYRAIREKGDVYKSYFAKPMQAYDLRNATTHECLYFLNFLSKNHCALCTHGSGPLHPSWADKNIWKQIVLLRDKHLPELPYLSLSLDLLAFQLGFDALQFSLQPFESIRNDEDEEELLEVAAALMRVLQQNLPKKREDYLSCLIEKSFKYKKYKVVRLLMEAGVQIKNYEQIFVHAREGTTLASKLGRYEEKSKLIEQMKAGYPEMYRRYQWEELINAGLRQEEGGEKRGGRLVTLGRGSFHVKGQIHAQLSSGHVVGDSLSRKDYMFSNSRTIAKVAIEQIEAYVELTEYPLLRYFYSFLLDRLGKESLALNFCSYFSEQGVLLQLIECIGHCFTFEKGLEMHSQKELKNYIREDEISEAIIISMILMPTNVHLNNIIVSLNPALKCRREQDRRSLFIVDFHDFYQKNGFELNGGHAALKVRNSLFLFEEMGNSVSAKLMRKYAEVNVLQVVSSVFKATAGLVQQANMCKPPCSAREPLSAAQQKQLFAVIFQKGYAFRMAERMFKIKCLLQKRIRQNLPLDHFDLLEAVDPQLRYYYEELLRSEHNLLERERMMLQDSYAKPLLVSHKLISFIAAGAELQSQVDTFPNHYLRFAFQGPTENLRHLNQRQQQLSVYTDKIRDLAEYSHSTIEYFVRNLDLSTYEKQEREQLFSRVQQYSLQYLTKEKSCLPLSVVRVTHVEGLKEKHLKFGCERLKDVALEDLSCSEGDLNGLIKKYESGTSLAVKRARGVERVGESLMGLAGMLEIRNIRRLSITECPNLVIIDIKADQLENAIMRNNSNLTHVYINSRKLINLDCSQCSKLRLQNIGIYIFMKCNVLLCSNSCDGDVKRLEDKNYSIFLTRILRYLFNRFHSENLYKLDLALTLNKLGLIDERYYTFGGTRFNPSGLANNLSFITKAGTEAIRITQEQLIQLFMKNEFIEVLSIDEMLKVQMECLRVAANYLKTTKISRPLKQLIFREFIRTPELEKEQLGIVYAMFELARVEKAFTLRLALVPWIEVQYYIELIRIVNNKETLEKLELVIENSEIENEFIEYVFNLDSASKICKLGFSHCSFQVNEKVAIQDQPAVREVEFTHCRLTNLKFIQKFVNAARLKVESCTVLNIIRPIYASMGTLRRLKVLELLNLKEGLYERKLELGFLFEQLGRLGALEELNFSGNRMDRVELRTFSARVSAVRLYELTLEGFYEPEADTHIDHFLRHEHLKIINISFAVKERTALLESFFEQLAHNACVIKLTLKTDEEVGSPLFLKLKCNRKLQHVHSNQPIPTWFRKVIAANALTSSALFESQPFELLTQQGRKQEDFYRVGLSLDGGGVRGLLLATELHYLSTQVKQPLHKIFDCVGGTSIGGILALASTGTLDGVHPLCSTSDLIDIFELYGNKIFKKSQMQQLASLFDTKYDIASFEELLLSKFKDCKLSETLRGTQVVVTAVNRLTNEEVIFRSIYSIFDRNRDFYMRDIARATSAAPIYFPSAEIKNLNATQKFSLIDGGVGLNNPSKLVIDDIVKLAQHESNGKNYFLLSLGTGKMKNEAIPAKAGIVNLEPIIDGFTVAANNFIEKDMTQNYRGHYLRVSPLVDLARKDAELDNTRPQILRVYKQAGLAAAQEEFQNKFAYGKFRDRSLVEWLQENTARKFDL